MKLTLVEKPKYLREIENHKELYKNKNLKFMKRNRNGIFYWRFLSYLEDIGYRPRTIQKYYDKLRNFLHFIGKKSLKKIKRKDVDEYLLFLKNEKKVAPYTIHSPLLQRRYRNIFLVCNEIFQSEDQSCK